MPSAMRLDSEPNPYRSPSSPPPPPPASRPPSLSVFGILNILYGVFGLCGLAGGLAVMFLVDFPQDPAFPNPALDLMKTDANYRLYLQVVLVLGGLMTLVLIAAGIGLLLAKAWGRTLSIGYAWYAIVSGIIGMIFNCAFVFKPMMAAAKEAQGPPAIGTMGGIFGGVIGGLLGLTYPILLLIFMNLATLRRAIAPREAA